MLLPGRAFEQRTQRALKKARLRPGESVAIFGFGGLGFSALQLAQACGAGQVFCVDVNAGKLKRAARLSRPAAFAS